MFYHVCVVFFFNDTATTEIYTLSLHDALPICPYPTCDLRPATCDSSREASHGAEDTVPPGGGQGGERDPAPPVDRKSTRLNSSHANISYAVFCLKKKKTHYKNHSLLHILHLCT